MLVHSTRNTAYSKKLSSFSYYLGKEAKKYKDPDTRSAIMADSKALKEIALYLGKHNPAKAAQTMFKLDAIALSIVPLEIFNYLEDFYN